MDIARYSLISYLHDELSTHAENVFPLSQTTEVLENWVVLTDIAFHGLYQEKKVSTNNSNLIWHQCRLQQCSITKCALFFVIVGFKGIFPFGGGTKGVKPVHFETERRRQEGT